MARLAPGIAQAGLAGTLRQYAADEIVWDDPPVDHEEAEAKAWASKRPRPRTIMPAPKRRLDTTERDGVPGFLDRRAP